MPIEIELQTILLDLLQTASLKGDCLPFIQKIDIFCQSFTDKLHPQLLHYLRNRSYEKALLFLKAQSLEKNQQD